MRGSGSLPVKARKAVVLIDQILSGGAPFPNSSALVGPMLPSRGHAVDAMRLLEKAGIIARSDKAWDTGRLLMPIHGLAKQYQANPRKWLDTRPYHRTATTGDRTRYLRSVAHPGLKPLQPGRGNTKLGGKVLVGSWRGASIYTLTLEERATCPDTCQMYRRCYGDNMHLAKRLEHGLPLEAAIELQLDKLCENDRPIVVRLHVLGDFYSVKYVEFWERMMMRFLSLRVFGYTAWLPGTEIGDAIQRMNQNFGGSVNRWAIRTSGYGEEMGAYVRSDEYQPMPAGSFQCPEQVGKLKSCGHCGACWATRRNVAFIQH